MVGGGERDVDVELVVSGGDLNEHYISETYIIAKISGSGFQF